MEKCSQCGVCCRLFIINLNEKEYSSKEYKTLFEKFDHISDFKEAEEIGANLLSQNKDGSCIYLKDKRCSIHDRRPEVCRKFFCSSKEKKYKDMIRKIKDENSKKIW